MKKRLKNKAYQIIRASATTGLVMTTLVGNFPLSQVLANSPSNNGTYALAAENEKALSYEVVKNGESYTLNNISVPVGDNYSVISITTKQASDLTINGYNASTSDVNITKVVTSEGVNYSLVFATAQNQDKVTDVLKNIVVTGVDTSNNQASITVDISKQKITKYVDEMGISHYYEYVPEAKTWLEAYNAAKQRTYKGLHGYLATITSQDEQDFIYGSIANKGGWLGGTRAVLNSGAKINDESTLSTDASNYAINVASNNTKWYWADGPEAGNTFYNTAYAGGTIDGVYSNFNSGEPNANNSNEAFLQFAFSGFGANPRKWNDLRNNANQVDNSWAGLEGYYVEYSTYGNEKEDLTNNTDESISYTQTFKSNDKPVIEAQDQTYKVGDKIDPLKDVKGTDKEDGTTEVKVAKIVDQSGKEVTEIPSDQPGEYTVTYTTTDKDGNTTTKDAKIVVNSNDKPVIEAQDQTYKVGDKIDPLKDVKGTDKEDGTTEVKVAKIVDQSGKEVTEIPSDQPGEYTVTYTTTDKDGNTTTKDAKIVVNSNDQPVIEAQDQTYKVGDKIDPLKDVKGTDKEDGTTEVKVAKIVDKTGKEVTEIPSNQPGEYTVTYTTTDKDGNTTTKDAKIVVNSNDQPVIEAQDQTYKVGDKIDPLKDVKGTDKEDGTTEVKVAKIVDQSGKEVTEIPSDQPGEYTVTYTTTDKDGNTTTKQIIITIKNKDAAVAGQGSSNQSQATTTSTTAKHAGKGSSKTTSSQLPQTGEQRTVINTGIGATILLGVAAIFSKLRKKN